MAAIILHRKALLIFCWLVLAAAILWWRTPPSFERRWVQMPNSISLETYLGARRAKAAYCTWMSDLPGRPPCRVS
jgi:hypothetical protein